MKGNKVCLNSMQFLNSLGVCKDIYILLQPVHMQIAYEKGCTK